MGTPCQCAQTSFAEYFTDEVERLQKQLEDFPETFKDIWSDLAAVQQDAIAGEALAAISQGVLSDPNLDALVDLVKATAQGALSTTQIPRFETALDELSRARDTQEAIKVIAGLVFVLWSDSIFHVLNSLARKIIRLAVLKAAAVERLRAALVVAGNAMAAFEAAGVDSQAIRDLILAAASDVQRAEVLVLQMKSRAVGGTAIRQTTIDRSVAELQSAIDRLADAAVDPELIRAGALSALLSSAEPLAVATGGMVVASMYIKQSREDLDNLRSQDRQLQASLVAFRAGLDKSKASSMTNYQYTILVQVQNRLASTRASMTAAARNGDMKELARGTPQWVSSLGVAQRMLANLPPEVRQQQELNAELLNAYYEACRQVDSINSDHITDGIEGIEDLADAGRQAIRIMENLFGQVRTGAVVDHVRYLAESSTGTPFGDLAFVSAELDLGSVLSYRMNGSSLDSRASWPSTTPAIARLDEAAIHCQLIIQIMQGYLEVQPPQNAMITGLLDLLKALQMTRGQDLLLAGDLDAFMASGPLQWTYAGNAVDCIQKGMEAALNAGQAKVYDQLDTILAPMQAKVSAIQLRMQRSSAYSLETILEKVEAQMAAFEATKETVEGLMNKVEC